MCTSEFWVNMVSPPAQALGEVSPRSGPNWQCTEGYQYHSLQLMLEKLINNIVGAFNNLGAHRAGFCGKKIFFKTTGKKKQNRQPYNIFGGFLFKYFPYTMLRDSLHKTENSVIICSPSCYSKSAWSFFMHKLSYLAAVFPHNRNIWRQRTAVVTIYIHNMENNRTTSLCCMKFTPVWHESE